MNKNSFTLFEVLISFVILSVVISGISKLFSGNDTNNNYYKLQKIENNYIENNTIINSDNIKLNLGK
ncbi:MAG: prepilin-type N-terminal cleavage/methylation domain-containing protein [Campylobacterota bacterium]|nr:prepilin-type N-terminal cleavage/methylation domain-containing protein [Campylobacterota bacterium]